ncbi:hypothetical protein C5O27_00795 [Gordonia alkanivorans]|nr:hypothetical protein C5O27_00795 [Gordonia alkanivorans]
MIHGLPLFLAIKEVVLYGDMAGEAVPTSEDLLAALLSLSAEGNEAAMPSDPAQFEQTIGELTLGRVTQASLLHDDPLELVAGICHATWHRGWSRITSTTSLSDLAAGPSEQWGETMGVELDEFLTLGWLFYNLWKHDGLSRFDPDFFVRHELQGKALDFLIKNCSISLSELRTSLQKQRDNNDSLWTRYQMQQRPFIRLDDGTLIPIRFQFVIQRIFGDHLFLESAYVLGTKSPKSAEHYKDAMRDIFEERVGDVLRRISRMTIPAGPWLSKSPR